MPNYRKIPDLTLCERCRQPIVQHHRTNRRKYHYHCKRLMNKASNLATQRLRRAGIYVSRIHVVKEKPDKGITSARQKSLGL